MKPHKAAIDQLRKLEESLWLEATRFDREYMERVLSPDFFEFGRSGKIYRREDTLSAPPEIIAARIPLANFEVHLVSEHVALVTYRTEVGTDPVLVGNRSSLWKKTADGWKIVFHQGTPAATK